MAETPFEIVKIDESSYCIENSGVRCLLFIGTEKSLLVDTGFGNAGSLKAVTDSLTDKPIMLVISHADIDHIGANAEFDEVYMHPAEMSRYSSDIPPLPLWEGDIIDIGGRKFEVILIPGHTPGSIALLDRDNRIIITGDTVSAGPVFMFGESRSLTAYMLSLKKLLSMSDAFDTIYPSHGTFPLKPEQITIALAAAEKLFAGELVGEDPPHPLPAKLYSYNGGMFFY